MKKHPCKGINCLKDGQHSAECLEAHESIYKNIREAKRKAPWTDYVGNDLYDGDTIIHPSGVKGVITYAKDKDLHTSWRVRYNDKISSMLSLQIGAKGRGVKYRRKF